MYFTDNLMIPKGAKNKYTAELMIDWVYDVDRAAAIADFIYYLSPVKGVAEAIAKLDPEAATNPLLFPPADVLAKQYPEAAWDDEDSPGADQRALRGPRGRLIAGGSWEDDVVRAPALAHPVAAHGARAALAHRLLRPPERPDGPHVALERHAEHGLQVLVGHRQLR